jgi:RecA-family ATPase
MLPHHYDANGGPDPGRCAGCGYPPGLCACPVSDPAGLGDPFAGDDPGPVPPAGEWPGEAGPQLVNLAGIQPEPVEWLWDDHLPLGKVVLLDGDPGMGKSVVSLDLAARVSTGAPMPDGSPGIKGAVLILSAEDGLADTIRPRIDAAGGDPAQITAMTGIICPGVDGKTPPRAVVIPRDLPKIERAVWEHRVVLVIVDVLMAYLGGDINSHHDQDVRRALTPLAALAERTGCCVLVLRHLNKSTGASVVYRGGGSIGIIGAARAAFICGTDPEDQDRRVLAPVKCNLSAEPPAITYQLAEDPARGCVTVRWLGTSQRRAWELLGDASDDDRHARDEAAEWLTAYLKETNGEARAADIIKAARADGIAERTLGRARVRAGITSKREGFGQGAMWRLPHSGQSGHASHTSGNGPNGRNGDPDSRAGMS